MSNKDKDQNWKSCYNCANKIATGDGCYKCKKNNNNVIHLGFLKSINTCEYYGEYKNWTSENQKIKGDNNYV